MLLKNKLALIAFVAKFNREKACHKYLALAKPALYAHLIKEHRATRGWKV